MGKLISLQNVTIPEPPWEPLLTALDRSGSHGGSTCRLYPYAVGFVDYWTKQSNDGIVRATSTGTRRRNISLRTIVKNTALTQVYCHGEQVIEDKTEWNRILELFPFPSLCKKERMLQKLGIFYSKGNVAVDEHEDRTSGLLLHVFGQGVTQVLFHGTNPDNLQSWKVSELTQPGDCILIPGQVKHTVRSRGERACFSFYHY
jgi:hypothetical protein